MSDYGLSALQIETSEDKILASENKFRAMLRENVKRYPDVFREQRRQKFIRNSLKSSFDRRSKFRVQSQEKQFVRRLNCCAALLKKSRERTQMLKRQHERMIDAGIRKGYIRSDVTG
jgi:hypothetical protein|tara:strand:+ start:235 stop:585 length:351 start_codon:yes stop_codon:yes gene_type:complete